MNIPADRQPGFWTSPACSPKRKMKEDIDYKLVENTHDPEKWGYRNTPSLHMKRLFIIMKQLHLMKSLKKMNVN